MARGLTDHLQTLGMGEDAEGYLLGRGGEESLLTSLGVREWAVAPTRCPSASFSKRYGERGQGLEGMVIFPLWAPSGTMVGFEGRSWRQKVITGYRLPEAPWNPVLLNAPECAVKLWAGGSAWIVEGAYDLFAMSRVIPKTDSVVSPLKAGLSKAHVRFFARFCRNRVYLVYDNDESGRRATLGGVDPLTKKKRHGAMGLLRQAGVNVIDYRYRGKDPGDVWSKGGQRELESVFLGRCF